MSRRVQLEARTAGEKSTDEPAKVATAVDPDRLTPEAILALQSRAGNGAVQRILAREPMPAPVQTGPIYPFIGGLSDMAQRLLDGVLQKDTIDAAVRQIYDNMFQKTGWTYNASEMTTIGKGYIDGTKTVGMCESYRNAFKEILLTYDRLRASHPTDAIKNGQLDIEDGQDLVEARFATRRGLTLMGATALKGNVYRVVDGTGNALEKGIDSINTFVFRYHWTLKVNGKEYDPIFHSIGRNNVASMLDNDYSDGGGRYLANTSKPITTNEFGATFIHVTDWATFEAVLDEAETLYNDNAADVDALADASFWKQTKEKVKPSELTKDARKIFKGINRDMFDEMVEVAYNLTKITRARKKAYEAVAKIA